MLPTEAARLLDLPANATPDQLEARFLELRRKLEDKIAKAPTPGLQAKYRESLGEITTAFETLTLAADSSTLPVLKKEAGGGRLEAGPADSGLPADATAGRPVLGGEPTATGRSGFPAPKRTKSGGKEFVLVAVIAVVVLGAGGWWVMKSKAENEEKARVAAAAKAEAEHQAEVARLAAEARKQAEEAEKVRLAAAAKAEQERLDREFALLRSKLAQLNVQAESLFHEEPSKATRRLAELKSDERSLARDKETGALVRLRAQLDAQQGYVDELDSILTRHPAKSTQARAGELVSAKELESAGEAVGQLAEQLEKLDALMADARSRADKAIYGGLKIECVQPDVQWSFTDAFGDKVNGRGTQTLSQAGIGNGTVAFSRAGWPMLERSVIVRRGVMATVVGDFRPARLTLTGKVADASYTLSDGQKGTLPAEIETTPGRRALSVTAPKHEAYTETLDLGIGEQRVVNVKLTPVPLWSQQELTDFVNGYTNAIRMYPYRGNVLSLGSPTDLVSAIVTSALPLTVTAATFPSPPATALKKPGEVLQVNRYQVDRQGMGIAVGRRLETSAGADVRLVTRPDCDGLVLLAGMVNPTIAGTPWVQPLEVYGATHPALVPLAQAWASSVRINLAGTPPAPANTPYRVVFAIKFRRAEVD